MRLKTGVLAVLSLGFLASAAFAASSYMGTYHTPTYDEKFYANLDEAVAAFKQQIKHGCQPVLTAAMWEGQDGKKSESYAVMCHK